MVSGVERILIKIILIKIILIKIILKFPEKPGGQIG